VPAIFTVFSYVAMSRSYQGIADAAECVLSFRDWVRITLVSNTANLLVTSAGLSGFAVRMYLLAQRGVPSGRAVLISLVQTFLTNFTLLLFILLGFVALLLKPDMPPVVIAAASAGVAGFAAVLAWGVVLVYRRRLRRRTLFFVADAGHRLLRRLAPRWTPGRVKLWRFQHNLNQGLEFLLARKERMWLPTCWILIDWLMMIGILWAAFLAVDYPISPPLVVIGFAVGICLTLVPLVPGGLGVMDFSMTGVFVSMSVPLERAAVAVLIYRCAYYVLPLLTSLFLFPGVMRQATHVIGRHPAARPFEV
jgi:glycosyltransferase 2 family protein